MFKHLEGARLGIFIFLGTVLVIVSIFLIGNRDSLFVTSIHIKTYFPTVEGLRSGAPVRLSGMDIGSVSSISLIEDSISRVEVVMRIEEKVQQFIRLDSRASIETEGLVGKKIVIITPGSPNMEKISDGGIIMAKPPVSMQAIIEESQSVISYLKDVTRDFSEITAKVNRGEGSIGKLINDDELYRSTVRITQSADVSLKSITKRLSEITDFVINLGTGVQSIISSVDTSVSDVKHLLQSVERGEGVLGALIADRSAYDSIKAVINNLVITTDLAMKGTEAFVENMEALKHNWLFKGYFEQRGYWDKVDYEKELDIKILELKLQNELLNRKLEELKLLGEKVDDLGSLETKSKD